MFSTVDLPAPFGPIMEMTERLGMSKLTPSTTALPSYFFVSSLTNNATPSFV